MHGDRDLSYKTRVFEVKYDLLSPDQTELSLGDDLSSNSITSQLNSLSTVADTTSSQTQWTINQIGRPGTTYGATAPDSPKVGDIWFKHLADGGTEIYRWNSDIWELLASPTTADDIATAVTDAVTKAKAHTDEVKQGLSNDIETAKSQAVSLASTAEENAKSEATSLFSRAQNALSDAKTDLTKSISSEASKAVAAANSQAQSYVNQAKSDINDTINALSVGGRNYLLNSNGSTLSSWTTVSGWQVVSDSTRGDVFSFTPTAKWTGGPTNSIIQSRTDFPTGGNVTVSFWAKASVDGANFHSEPHGSYKLFDVKLSTTWKRYSYTFVLKTNTVYFMPVDAGTIYYLDDLQLETGNMMSDYKQAPEDVVLDYTTKDNEIKETITQYQKTNDGKVTKAQTDATTALGLVETKVSQTDYDQKTGDLSTKINDVKDTADKSAQTISDIQEADGKRDSRISEVEKTAGEIKSTVSDISTAQEKQSGYLSTLQQTAKGFEATVTKVNNLSVGSRNLLLNSKVLSWDVGNNTATTSAKVSYDSITNMWHITSPKGGFENAGIFFGQVNNVSNLITKGQQWAFSFDIKGTGVYSQFGIEGSSPFNKISGNVPTDWTRVSSTGTAAGTNAIIIYFNSMDVALDVYIKLPKLETGTIPTDWTPAPEDVDSTIAKVKLTADEASAAVIKLTSADGVITKAQAAIKVNADAINEKVSKTVYDQKNGELLHNINEAKDTADKSLRTIGDYKTSNDKRVHDAESNIERTANAITEKVSRTDYDNKTGELTHDISELKHTADGFEATVTKVNNLAVGGRNLLLGTATPWTVKANNNNFNFDSIYDHLKGGTTYTFSAEISVSNGQDSVSVGAFDASIGTTWGFSYNFSKGVKRGSFTFTTPDHIDNDGHLIVYAGTQAHTAGLSATYTHMKLEEGNVPTAWTQAPEDMESALAQVKATADGISNFVRDSSGNISTDFQTALSKTSIIAGSTLASSIQKQTETQISSALTDNNGKIISLINQDSSGVQIAGKNIVLNGDTTVTGAFKVSQANIANGAIGTAQIGDAAITSAKIANLDVSKITGNVTNFIQSNWNGVYESTTITNNGMQIATSDITTSFGPRGVKLIQGGESVGGIGVSSYVEMPTNFQGIAFNLDGTGDYMTWSARDSGVTTGDYTTKLAWFRSSYKPIGQNAGFNFSSDSPVTFWGDIYGRENTEPLKIANFGMHGVSAGGIGHGNGSSAITFGGDGEIYIVSGGQYYKLAQFVKALQPLIGLGTWSAPKNINSNGVVTQWTNITT